MASLAVLPVQVQQPAVIVSSSSRNQLLPSETIQMISTPLPATPEVLILHPSTSLEDDCSINNNSDDEDEEENAAEVTSTDTPAINNNNNTSGPIVLFELSISDIEITKSHDKNDNAADHEDDDDVSSIGCRSAGAHHEHNRQRQKQVKETGTTNADKSHLPKKKKFPSWKRRQNGGPGGRRSSAGDVHDDKNPFDDDEDSDDFWAKAEAAAAAASARHSRSRSRHRRSSWTDTMEDLTHDMLLSIKQRLLHKNNLLEGARTHEDSPSTGSFRKTLLQKLLLQQQQQQQGRRRSSTASSKSKTNIRKMMNELRLSTSSATPATTTEGDEISPASARSRLTRLTVASTGRSSGKSSFRSFQTMLLQRTNSNKSGNTITGGSHHRSGGGLFSSRGSKDKKKQIKYYQQGVTEEEEHSQHHAIDDSGPRRKSWHPTDTFSHSPFTFKTRKGTKKSNNVGASSTNPNVNPTTFSGTSMFETDELDLPVLPFK